jgi:hypothetical protein
LRAIAPGAEGSPGAVGVGVTGGFEPDGVRVGVVRGISYGLFEAPGEFVAAARGLGAMAALYDQMADLPPTLQMFMAGCPADLAARRDRINCRQLVVRTVLALAGGVHRTAYWNLAPEYPGPVDHRQMMHLLIGKLPLLGYLPGELRVRHPAADTFALLAELLAGATSVTRAEGTVPATLQAYRIDRAGRAPVLVFWDHRDAFAGEDEPPVTITWPWPAATASVTDVFGQTRTIQGREGQLRLAVSGTPLFVTRWRASWPG